MTRYEIKEFIIENDFLSSLKHITVKLKNNYPEIYNHIINSTSYLLNCKFTERLYHIFNDLYEEVVCLNCKRNKVSFISFNQGYSTFCSNKCIRTSEITINKYKDTCIRRYGVTNPSKLNSVKRRKEETCLKNHGVKYYQQSEEGKLKFENTMLETYGVRRPLQNDKILEQQQQTCVEKFGFKNASKNDDVKLKILNGRSRFLEDEEKVKESRRKFVSTCISKYNTVHPMKSKEVSNKVGSSLRETQQKRVNIICNSLGYELLDEYNNAIEKVRFKCKKCNNILERSWNSIQQGFLCINCYPRNNGTSIQEIEIYNFIKSILKNEDVIQSDRTIISPKELDIYIPSKNIAIEYDGLYWHSEQMETPKDYHLSKTLLCDDKNIRLIHIFEDEWLLKQDIVKERLKSILNINDKFRIHARQCNIEEIDSKIKNNFLEKYHIQGKDNSVVKLGAFYNNELISVMTFSYGNISKGSKVKSDVWELNRFCSNYNYHIPGIASKLLTYFKRNYTWKEIFTYADLRWSNGNLYKKLGFKCVGHTGINYWYTKDFQRIHRFGLRKTKDDPKDIPEWALRQSEGYFRIWDCGSLKFTSRNK